MRRTSLVASINVLGWVEQVTGAELVEYVLELQMKVSEDLREVLLALLHLTHYDY